MVDCLRRNLPTSCERLRGENAQYDLCDAWLIECFRVGNFEYFFRKDYTIGKLSTMLKCVGVKPIIFHVGIAVVAVIEHW